ncbi:EF-Tu/IF-2/RF-3 family GTPase [Kribbella sp. NPDC051718]|uniref:EF-Tu/IF-2/RF-3 family GTPase n=1 Tax=Kribbella sp. NPDC051718 TaxID=3155168 RepID=UPI003415236D
MGWKFWKQEPRVQDTVRPQDVVPTGPFTMPVEDVFSITGRGTVVTGRITAGTVTEGDQVLIMRAGQQVAMSRVTGVEAFRKKLTAASAGENVGLLLEGIDRSQVLAGDVISR